MIEWRTLIFPLRAWRSTRGRVGLTALPVIALVAGLVLGGISVLPAGAGNGAPSVRGVQPIEVDLGGAPNDCSVTIPGRLPSAAAHELRIQNPQNGTTYNGVAGVSFTLSVGAADEILGIAVNGNAIVLDAVVKGGQKSTHFDYDGNGGPGGVQADQGLHAPTKGGGSSLYKLSHVSLCYETSYAAVGGTVFVDDNVNGVYDTPPEGPDTPLLVTGYHSGSFVQTTSAGNGTYQFLLKSGTNVTVCEAARDDIAQTTPMGTACAALGSGGHEGAGHVVSLGVTGVPRDFGNAAEVCGQTLTSTGAVFAAQFTLFENGNSESGCDDKLGALYEADGQLNLPLSGAGQAAGIGIVTKTFSDPSAFVGLQYSQGASDVTPAPGGFEEVPWCTVRAKVAPNGNLVGDGNEFDAYVSTVNTYPSMAGVHDPDSGDPSVSCKVFEQENVEGSQTTVLLVQGDPFYK